LAPHCVTRYGQALTPTRREGSPREAASLAKHDPSRLSSLPIYTDSALNPEAPSGLEFQRLRKEQGWKRGDAVGEAAWQDFRSALVLEFNGTEPKDLLAWQTLCVIVGIEEVDKIADYEVCEKASAWTYPSFEQPWQAEFSNFYRSF
jgi:hypothetical protein